MHVSNCLNIRVMATSKGGSQPCMNKNSAITSQLRLELSSYKSKQESLNCGFKYNVGCGVGIMFMTA